MQLDRNKLISPDPHYNRQLIHGILKGGENLSEQIKALVPSAIVFTDVQSLNDYLKGEHDKYYSSPDYNDDIEAYIEYEFDYTYFYDGQVEDIFNIWGQFSESSPYAIYRVMNKWTDSIVYLIQREG